MPKKRARVKPARERSERKRAPLELLPTGVPGLDEVLGGGLPALSFNLIAGGPGTGKTTLAMQLMFANASAEHPALYFTLLGETSLKMLRYQQLFEFFDRARVGSAIHFHNLSEEVMDGDLGAVLARIVEEVDRIRPAWVVIDSFRSLARTGAEEQSDRALDRFVQRLALHLTTWEVTSFLIGEYEEQELRNPVFTVADGILWLSQAPDRNSVVRKLQVVKARGMALMPGLHTMRITDRGVQVFPRIPERPDTGRRARGARLSTGIPGLDEMMDGGIPAGDSLVLAGSTGTGKTTFATQFVAAGLRAGEHVVIAVFEEHPDVYLNQARSSGVDFRAALRDGRLRIMYLRPLDLSVDETLEEIRTAVREIDATRVVIDSISGFEMALAPTFREDFRESLYRLIGTLTGLGVTIFSTVEVVDASEGLRLTGYRVSFLTDDIITQRYLEVEGELLKVLAIMKMRGSNHSTEFRVYELTPNGVLMRQSLRDYDGILTGMPTRQDRLGHGRYPGLTEQEILVLEAIVRWGAESRSAIEEQTGLAREALDAILDRLIQLRYVSHTGTMFRGVAQPRGP
ncbi:MAG TPA: ATPase domain-containing protein [Gemmatimonadales bacterium]|nr:ATPase domain-containing protein [Gemmatimonadales bacterium]